MDTITDLVKDAKQIFQKECLLNSSKRIHRRRMAYLALYSIIAVTFCCVFFVPTQKLDALKDIISWFYITMSSIVGAYVGFATLDDKWSKTKKTDSEDK